MSDANNQDLETVLNITDYLNQEQYDDVIASLREGRSHVAISGAKSGNLSVNSFKNLLSTILGLPENDERLVLLCRKIDSNGDGYINEAKFVNYILHYLQEKEAATSTMPVPFQDLPTFKHNIYSKQSPCRILSTTSPPRLLTVSKDGVITTWSPSLQLQQASVVDDKATVIDKSQLARLKRINVWVTDAVLFSNCNILVVSTNSRELYFYDISATVYKCQYHLCDIPYVPLCMTSYTKSTGSVYLLYGDECGNVTVLLFHCPTSSLFLNNSKDVSSSDDVQMILLSQLPDHSKYVSVTFLNHVHSDWIHHIMYLPHNHSIITCSSSSEKSLILKHLENKRKPYIFNITKGVFCFDFNHSLELLVTGSADHIVRLWVPYVTSRPIASLIEHRAPILDVLIHKEMGILFSFSQDSILCAWDIKEYILLQKVNIKFPFSQRQPEYGPTVLTILPPSTLTIACNEYIGEYRLGSSGSVCSRWSVVSHLKPLTAAVYDSCFQQVLSGCEGGDINIWDINTGAKSLRIKEAHDQYEITCMSMDATDRRLITGSRAGEIKIWNSANGECLSRMMTSGQTEVTGLVHILDRAQFLAVGWNKRISCFSDKIDTPKIPAQNAWLGPDHHNDDIITMSFCPPHYLATGSFDGNIIIWNTDIEKSIIHFKTTIKSRSTMNIKTSRRNSISRSGIWSRSSISSLSRPSSRRLSTYYLRSNSLNLEHVPVDKLLFLKNRMRARQKEKSVLVSSEAGFARFWAFPGFTDPRGSFKLTCYENENVLSLSTDQDNQFLVAGDTAGYISIFDIKNYCNGLVKTELSPKPLVTWQAHAGEILSVEYIGHETQPLVLSASADCTVRLWNLKGHYIGTFGQKLQWNLSNSASFQYPKTPWGQLMNPNESNKLLEIGTSAINGDVSKQNSNKQQLTDDTKETVANQEEPLVSMATQSGSSIASSSSTLPPIYDEQLYDQYTETVKKRMENKSERRQNYSEVNMKSTERFGLLCSPYQALQLLQMKEMTLPESLSEVIQLD